MSATRFDIVFTGPELEHTRRPELYGSFISTFALATVAVVLRFTARRIAGVRLWLDDWFSLAAYIFISAQFGMLMYGTWRGLGVHIISLLPENSIEDIVIFFQILLAEEVLYNASLLFIKLAILALYWRLFHPAKYMRVFLRIAAPLVVAWSIAFFVATLAQCVPLSDFWNTERRVFGRGGYARCGVDEFGLYMGGAVVHIVADVFFVLAPIPAIWNLPRPPAQKIAVTCMFLLGGFVCVVSILRLWKLLDTDFETLDLTWSFTDIAMWTVIETNVALVCACLPSLRPIMLLFSPSFKTVDESLIEPDTPGFDKPMEMTTWYRKNEESNLENQPPRSPTDDPLPWEREPNSPTSMNSFQGRDFEPWSDLDDVDKWPSKKFSIDTGRTKKLSIDTGRTKQLSLNSYDANKLQGLDSPSNSEFPEIRKVTSHRSRKLSPEKLRAIEAFDEDDEVFTPTSSLPSPYQAGVDAVRQKLQSLDIYDAHLDDDDELEDESADRTPHAR